jgi:5-methylcytosine-specific restriction protein A
MCQAFTSEGYYCDEHRPVHRSRSGAATDYRKMYATSKWKASRVAYLAKYPVCRSCGRLAEVVDHIKPHRGDVKLFWDINNWQPLCKVCHDKKTGRGE